MAKKFLIGNVELATKSQLDNSIADVNTTLANKQNTLVSGTNIKTINGESVLGSGDIAIKSFATFDNNWNTNSTVDNFCYDINQDPNAVEGMAYLGGVYFSDLPFVGNADAVVEIISGTGTSNKVIHITITSGNISPYHWEYTYWNNGSNTSGWISFEIAGSSSANYNDLSNKPIINQDLDDVGFSPTANTYYKHIGASALTYEIGRIYYYDGTYFNAVLSQNDVETTAVQNSTKPISSGAVYTILDGINARLQNI